jgi:hypothetical protein
VAFFRAVDFRALATFLAPDFLVAAAFFAAVTLFADLAFLVAAAFLAAVDRFALADLRADFLGAMSPPL